eukprot:GILJ01000816.1.p1 GENE.GILJ01000816.1~~GILJ01000816.1.p1  ORF type:complete len:311 (-),score=55.93 GILJ01000816.1:490-1422(-)
MNDELVQRFQLASLSDNHSTDASFEKGKVFVGGVTWQTNEEMLREHFAKFGDVTEVIVMRDRYTGNPRGFGFVGFKDAEVAEKVMQESHIIDGRRVDVKPAVPKDSSPKTEEVKLQTLQQGAFERKKLFVGGLAQDVDENAFTQYFSRYGPVTECLIMYDRGTNKSRGFGFITFESEESLEKALLEQHNIHGKYVEVKKAVPKEQQRLLALSGPRSGVAMNSAMASMFMRNSNMVSPTSATAPFPFWTQFVSPNFAAPVGSQFSGYALYSGQYPPEMYGSNSEASAAKSFPGVYRAPIPTGVTRKEFNDA